MRFGLALSGGGLRGTAHIGVLRALEENYLVPSWISGASAGSIIGGLYACGYSPDELEDLALRQGKFLMDPDISGILAGFIQLLLGKEPCIDGIIKGKQLERLFKKLTRGCLIKEVRIPLAITAVNINNGQTIIFVSNKRGLPKDNSHICYMDNIALYKAIRASIAIPVVFKPFVLGGMRLVDGGVTDSMPVEVLKKMGAKRVIGVDLGYSGQLRKGVNNIIEIGNQAVDIMAYQITRFKSRQADCIIRPGIYDVGLTEFEKIPKCIKRGYEVTMENINLIKKAINSKASTSLFYTI